MAAVPTSRPFLPSTCGSTRRCRSGAGLSSSAAIEGAVAVALNDVWQLGLDPTTLARVGRSRENEGVGAPTGIMDQTASMLGRADHAVFLDCRSLETGAGRARVRAGGTRAARDGHDREALARDRRLPRAPRVMRARSSPPHGVASLRDLTVDDLDRARTVLDDVTFRRVRHVVTENQRVLDTVRTLREDEAARDRATARRIPRLDARRLRDLGAGAGPRGRGRTEQRRDRRPHDRRRLRRAAIALVPVDDVSRIQVALDGAFAEHGFPQPVSFTVTASDGAKRDR